MNEDLMAIKNLLEMMNDNQLNAREQRSLFTGA